MKKFILTLSLFMLLLAAAGCGALGLYPVETIAGTGNHGAMDSEYGLAQFNLPAGIFGGEGDALIVLDTYNNLIREIDLSIDYEVTVRRITGNILMSRRAPRLDDFRFPQGSKRDGLLDNALFNRPTAGVMDSEGRMFIADRNNHAIRMISDGVVSTFAGGRPGHQDGQGANAMFYYPTALAIGENGTLHVADTGNSVIRSIDINGYVTTVAGVPGVFGYYNGDAHMALFNEPMGIAVMGDIIFVADTNNHLIRIIENGHVRTFAGVYQLPDTTDSYDEWDMLPVGGFSGGTSAMFNMPMGLTVWGDVLIIADSLNHAIRGVIYPMGEVFTIAGTGEPGHYDGYMAMFHLPRGVYVSGDELFIADTGNNMIRKIYLAAIMQDWEVYLNE